MDVNAFINRAKSGVGKITKYASPGVMPSFASSSWPQNAKNDCSGFVAWSLRFPGENRKVDHPLYVRVNGGWFETSAIHADGLASTGYFTKITDPIPGAMLVSPDYTDSTGTSHDGHIGIVLEVNGVGINGVNKIIHCSHSGYINQGDAIQITGPAPWLAHSNSIIEWFDGLTT